MKLNLLQKMGCHRTVSYTHLDVYKRQVLYDPETKQFYMPNMNKTGGLGQKESGPEQKEGEKEK